MADRRLPYARTLAVLRVLSWPYRYPPLSWMVGFNNWVAASNARLTVAMGTSVVVVVGSIVWTANRG